jgi:predicted phage terminase large subunit-like protein
MWARKISLGMWSEPSHLKLLDKALVDVAFGRCRRLIVMMPPRHGKSELISKYLPAWYLGMWPDKRVILTSYEADFASQWGRKARTLLEQYGQSSFKVSVSRESSAADRWEIEGHSGGMQTAGIRGPITGKGADLLIIDDPVKNDDEARSELIRQRNWDWYTDTARTRLEPGGSIVVVMTRWHEDDLVGRMLKDQQTGDKWRVIQLSALAEQDDVLGRTPGEALWPQRYDANALNEIRRGMSPYSWASLYQQAPTVRGGNVFKDSWWKYYNYKSTGEEIRIASRMIVQAWDTAFKTGQSNDYSVCTTWADTVNGAYLVGMWRGRVEFPDLVKAATSLIGAYRPTVVLVEDKASGQSLVQEMQRVTRTPILPVGVDKDKVARAYSITPEIEGGRVFLPEDLTELHNFLSETAGFPNAAHDDIVDSMTLALSYLMSKRNAISRVVIRQQPAYQNNSRR